MLLLAIARVHRVQSMNREQFQAASDECACMLQLLYTQHRYLSLLLNPNARHLARFSLREQ